MQLIFLLTELIVVAIYNTSFFLFLMHWPWANKQQPRTESQHRFYSSHIYTKTCNTRNKLTKDDSHFEAK